MRCDFCHFAEVKDFPMKAGNISYICGRCGHVHLDQIAADDFEGERFSAEEKKIFSITIRNEYERRNRRPFDKALTLADLHRMSKQYRRLDPLEKMDQALLNLEKATEYFGQNIELDLPLVYPYYHCFERRELDRIIEHLHRENFITSDAGEFDPKGKFYITPNGYARLRELKRRPKDARQCFVAMWLAPKMNHVYEKAIVPAIEYIEDDETEPRFKALRIDNKEHTNDINDEIIAEIRRSRFMVCDLTGYRGGVYFEAGFAFGLGLEVIYTCRKDWIEGEALKADNGKVVEKLRGVESGNEIEVKKEGIHFDLEHRNRIEWEETGLDDFKDRLTKRIKAVIL